MTQSIGSQLPESRPLQTPRRGTLRRGPKPTAERRAQFVRSDVRRGALPAAEIALEENQEEESGQAREQLATLQVQASIVAAMIGMLVFFRAPLEAALASLFG